MYYLKKIGGKTSKENVKNVMQRMMEVHVMAQFNMKGVNRKSGLKKRKFDNNRLCEAIIGKKRFVRISLLMLFYLIKI